MDSKWKCELIITINAAPLCCDYDLAEAISSALYIAEPLLDIPAIMDGVILYPKPKILMHGSNGHSELLS